MSRTFAIVLLLASATAAFAQPAEPVPVAETVPVAEPEPTPAPEATPTPAPTPAPSVAATPALSLDKTVEAAPKTKPEVELKPGGYLQVDGRRFVENTGAHDVTVRRLRFKLDGTATKLLAFRTLIDFAGS